MRTMITKLCLMTAILALCIFMSVTTVQPAQADEQAQYEQAMELIDNWEGRVSHLEKASQIALMMAERNPNSVRAGVILCRAVWLTGYKDENNYSRRQLEETQACYRRAIEADPEFLDAVYYLGMSHAMVQNHDQALVLAEQLEKKHPIYFRGYFIRMAVAEKKKDDENLLQLGLKQQNRFPDNEKSLKMAESYLLTAYLGLNMLDQAEAIYLKRVQEQPDSTRPLRNYAAFLRQYKQDHAKADEYENKALALINDVVDQSMPADAAVKKGNELLTREKYEEAEPYFKLALEKETDSKEAWAGLAQVNYHLGKQNNDLERMKKAQEAITKATQSGKPDPKYDDLESMRIEMELLKMKHDAGTGGQRLESLIPPRPVVRQTQPSQPGHIEKVKPIQRQP
jgi:tetratricopeptide (TPR) repeat protein